MDNCIQGIVGILIGCVFIVALNWAIYLWGVWQMRRRLRRRVEEVRRRYG